MFESRRALLTIAVALALLALTSVGVAQVWNVEAVGEPERLHFLTLSEFLSETGPCNDPQKIAEFLTAPRKDEILVVGGLVSRPVLLSERPPRYTEAARRACIQGTVILRAVIDEEGRVADVHILKSLPLGLDQVAIETVRDWIFEPATLNGWPVKVYHTLAVDFRLPR